MFKTLSVITLLAAAVAPSFAQSQPDASAERGTVPEWTGVSTTRAQVHQAVLQARQEGTLSYVGDQPVFKRRSFAATQAQTMGYGDPAPAGSASSLVSHDGYRLVGDVYVHEGRR